jgi:RNA polymerase-binding transcription factor DksA
VTDVPTDPHDAGEAAAPAAGDAPPPDADEAGPVRVDLDRIERDLAGVEAALRRLDDGTYWTDEVTGAPIPDDVLAADPVARRAG